MENSTRLFSREGMKAYRAIPFDRLGQVTFVEHRLARVNHPWTIGPIEGLDRTIKKNTVQRICDRLNDHLRIHPQIMDKTTSTI